MSKQFARRPDKAIKRQALLGGKIFVHFDAPAGTTSPKLRRLLPILPDFSKSGSRGLLPVVGVRAFGGLWSARAQVVGVRDSAGRLMRGSNGEISRARVLFVAEHVAWLDEMPGSGTPAQIQDALQMHAFRTR